jgi:hypothetical protein
MKSYSFSATKRAREFVCFLIENGYNFEVRCTVHGVEVIAPAAAYDEWFSKLQPLFPEVSK